MFVGAGVTFVVQSSSVFTSAITPLVGEYMFLLPCKDIYEVIETYCALDVPVHIGKSLLLVFILCVIL